jgi:methionyl-tRNA synthetase
MGKYYISTAIAYTSDKPHIGNTYEIVLADAIARYKRAKGYDVYFQTGTDEHGQKIEEYAKKNNKDTQKYVDEKAKEVKDIWDIMNTSYDRFVRTTDPVHMKKVAKIFKRLYDQGDIYLGKYEGLYCTPCESFYTESQLVNNVCPDCGRSVCEACEEAYFLKLSKYSKRLEDYINEHPDFIEPESRKNEIINNFIKPGIQDLCVSRTSFKWGIPVSFDDKHIIYVWIDALSNYITFLGYDPDGNHREEFKKYWPADVHLIGKDILRFHTIYWPVMLMALDLPLPKKIFGHPWMLFSDDKMSKSKGNIVYADKLVDVFGVDAVRYYMLHEIPFASDGNFTNELLIERINGDLANVLGNLVNRTIAMTYKYFNGIVSNPGVIEDIDADLINLVNNASSKVDIKMDNLRIADAIDEIFEIFRRSNKYIDETTPWVLAHDETKQDRLKTVLYHILESIRIGAILLEPFLPDTSNRIMSQLNTTNKDLKFGCLKEGIKLNEAAPLFARLNKEEILTKLND